jgi:hypothetical protein
MTREEIKDKSLQTRITSFRKWWKKNGNLKENKNKNHFYRKKNAQRALILGAKRTVTMYCATDLERQIVFFQEKRYNNSQWGKLTKEDAWTLWRLTNPTYSHRLQLLQDSAEEYSKQRQALQDELRLLKALKEKYGNYPPKKKTNNRPTVTYKRKTA